MPEKDGPKYFRSEEGHYVAWSLATPPHEYGEWNLISISVIDEIGATGKSRKVVRVEFVRALTPAEVVKIRSRVHGYWGERLRDDQHEWVVVRGDLREGPDQDEARHLRPTVAETGGHPLRFVGV